MTRPDGGAPAPLLRERCAVDDVALTQLHAAAFGETPRLRPWGAQLAGHSLTWFCAVDCAVDSAVEGARTVGFVNVAWDGAAHAFLLDLVVAPDRQRRGTGTALVAAAVRAAADAGCTWLHADWGPGLERFFGDRCGFPATAAGLRRLHR